MGYKDQIDLVSFLPKTHKGLVRTEHHFLQLSEVIRPKGRCDGVERQNGSIVVARA